MALSIETCKTPQNMQPILMQNSATNFDENKVEGLKKYKNILYLNDLSSTAFKQQ